MQLEDLESLLNEITKVHSLSLIVFNPVTKIPVVILEDVEDRQDLTVVWYESFTNHLTTQYQCLQDLQHSRNEFRVSCVQRCLDGNNELRHNGKHLGASLLQHVVCALHCQETVRVLFFSEAIKEHWQVMMVVQLLDVNLPSKLTTHCTMEDLHRQISAIIKPAELGFHDRSPVCGASTWRRRSEASGRTTWSSKGLAQSNFGPDGWSRRAFAESIVFRKMLLPPGTILHVVLRKVTKKAVIALWEHAGRLASFVRLEAITLDHLPQRVLNEKCASGTWAFHLCHAPRMALTKTDEKLILRLAALKPNRANTA
mmetsp:Transcript_46382/g.76921  ORF Transcript_46382/g.76921 Transcript_46382/m.76921 type:complete len:313 (+) Transcript_46382:155-1093(+)